MTFSPPNGIYCDDCGNKYEDVFIYYSLVFNKVSVNMSDGLIDRSNNILLDLDVCEGCYKATIENRILKSLSPPRLDNIKCDLCIKQMSGNFDYFISIVHRVIVDKEKKQRGPASVEQNVFDLRICEGCFNELSTLRRRKMIEAYKLYMIEVCGEAVEARPVEWDGKDYDGEGNDENGRAIQPIAFLTTCPKCSQQVFIQKDKLHESNKAEFKCVDHHCQAARKQPKLVPQRTITQQEIQKQTEEIKKQADDIEKPVQPVQPAIDEKPAQPAVGGSLAPREYDAANMADPFRDPIESGIFDKQWLDLDE